MLTTAALRKGTGSVHVEGSELPAEGVRRHSHGCGHSRGFLVNKQLFFETPGTERRVDLEADVWEP